MLEQGCFCTPASHARTRVLVHPSGPCQNSGSSAPQLSFLDQGWSFTPTIYTGTVALCTLAVHARPRVVLHPSRPASIRVLMHPSHPCWTKGGPSPQPCILEQWYYARKPFKPELGWYCTCSPRLNRPCQSVDVTECSGTGVPQGHDDDHDGHDGTVTQATSCFLLLLDLVMYEASRQSHCGGKERLLSCSRGVGSPGPVPRARPSLTLTPSRCLNRLAPGQDAVDLKKGVTATLH